MIEYKEVWSRKNSSIALAVFDNALNDHKLDSQKLISTPEHRPKQKDSFHPRWYGTNRNHIQVAKDKWAKNEGLPPHEHVSRPGYYQYMINNNYPDLHIDEFIYVIYGQLLVKIYDIDDLLIHDQLDKVLAMMLSELTYNKKFPTPIGIIYKEDKPTYEDMLIEKISIAQSHRKGDLQSLLEDSHTWLVS